MKHLKLYEEFDPNIMSDLHDIGMEDKSISITIDKGSDFGRQWLDENNIRKFLSKFRMPYRLGKAFKCQMIDLKSDSKEHLSSIGGSAVFADSKNPTKDDMLELYFTIYYDQHRKDFDEVSVEYHLTRDGVEDVNRNDWFDIFLNFSKSEDNPNADFVQTPDNKIPALKYKRLLRKHGNPIFAMLDLVNDLI